MQKQNESKWLEGLAAMIGNGLCLMGGVALAVFVQAILGSIQS